MPTFKLTLVLLIMSYAQESGAVGKEKVNFAEREWTVLFPEPLARVFGRLPFFVAPCTSLWTMVLKTDGALGKKKKPSKGWLIPAESGLHSGHVSICKLLVIGIEAVVKAPRGWRTSELGHVQYWGWNQAYSSTPQTKSPMRSLSFTVRLLELIDHF